MTNTCAENDEADYDEVLQAERSEFIRKAKALGYRGSLTAETAVSRLVHAAQTGKLRKVPDPVTAGIFEQMEQQVGALLPYYHRIITKFCQGHAM